MQSNRYPRSKHLDDRVAITGRDLQEVRTLSRNIYSSTLEIRYSPLGINIETSQMLQQPFYVYWDFQNSRWSIGASRSSSNPAYIFLGGSSEQLAAEETSLGNLYAVTPTTSLSAADGFYTLCINILYSLSTPLAVSHTYRWLTVAQMPYCQLSGSITIPLATVQTTIDPNSNDVSYSVANYQMGHIVLPMRIM